MALHLHRSRFEQLKPGLLPPDLQHLMLRGSISRRLAADILPQGLLSLVIFAQYEGYKPVFAPDSLPRCLRLLNLRFSPAQPVPPHCLPEGLRLLFFWGEQKYPLGEGVLPSSFVGLRAWLTVEALRSTVLPTGLR
jgi:hypothetical protein